MSIDNFVPEFWSTRLLRHLDPVLVYASPTLSNRDYEGEIAQSGDTVHIQKVNDPTIVNYVKGTPMTPERPDGTTIALTIDRDKGFYIQMDDLDAVQVNVPLFDRFASRTAFKMGKTIDADIGARMVAGAGLAVGTDASPVTINGGSPNYGLFSNFAKECRRKLDNNEAPVDGRWMVINPDIESIALDDTRFIEAGSEKLANPNLLGYIMGFSVYKTTQTPSSPGSGGSPVANWKVLFGAGNYATSVATQFVKTEAERLQGLFEDAVKGRHVWGGRVIEPETLGVAHVKKPF